MAKGGKKGDTAEANLQKKLFDRQKQIAQFKARNPVAQGEISEEVRYYQPFNEEGSTTKYLEARDSRGLGRSGFDVRGDTPAGVFPTTSQFSPIGEMSEARRNRYREAGLTGPPELNRLRKKEGKTEAGEFKGTAPNMVSDEDYLPGIDTTGPATYTYTKNDPGNRARKKGGRSNNLLEEGNLTYVLDNVKQDKGPNYYGIGNPPPYTPR